MVAVEERSQRVIVRGSGRRLWCRCPKDADGVVTAIDPSCLWSVRELLYDGPAGCGKTFYNCLNVDWICTEYPDARVLEIRETVKSLRESVQEIYEDHVLGPGHPVLAQGGSRANRVEYNYPRDQLKPDVLDGGHIALGGLDRPDLYHSSQWDLINFREATNPRVREYDYSKIVGRGLRGTGIPHPHSCYPKGIITDDRVGPQFKGRRVRDVYREWGEKVFPRGIGPDGHPLFFRQARLECNPSDIEGENHWCWQRFEAGKLVRLAAKHTDNPTADEEYLRALSEMPEPLRTVFFEGKWFASSGLVWPTYDAKKHLIRGEFEFSVSSGNRWVRIYDWTDDSGNPKVFPIVSVVAGFDWGLTSPSTLQIFAITADRIAFRVAEIYRVSSQTGRPLTEEDEGSLGWFAKQVVALTDTHALEAVYCDPSSPTWEMFNAYLAKHGKSPIAQPGTNTRKTKDGIQGGLDLVRSLFGRNRLFLFSNCHIGPIDPTLRRLARPIGWDRECPHYRLARDPDDETKVLDFPDPSCIDHGCDAARLVLVSAFHNERVVKPKPAVAPLKDPWIAPTMADLEEERAAEQRGQLRSGRQNLRSLRGR